MARRRLRDLGGGRSWRTWRRARLGLVSVLVLVGAAWVVSVWWSAGFLTGSIPIFSSGGSGVGVGFSRGALFGAVWWDGGFWWAPEVLFESAWGDEYYWWFDGEVDLGASGSVLVGVPMWLVAIVVGLVGGVLLWWLRMAEWVCRGCGYDLRGSGGEDGALARVCPECGGRVKYGAGAEKRDC